MGKRAAIEESLDLSLHVGSETLGVGSEIGFATFRCEGVQVSTILVTTLTKGVMSNVAMRCPGIGIELATNH